MNTKNQNGIIAFNVIMRWIEADNKWYMLHAKTHKFLFYYDGLSLVEKIKRKIIIYLVKKLEGINLQDCANMPDAFPNLSKDEDKEYTIRIKEVKG